jgi:seryl-tRNA synthetase
VKSEGKYEEIVETRRKTIEEIEAMQKTDDKEIENLEIQLALLRSENDLLIHHIKILSKDLSLQAKSLKDHQNDLSSYLTALSKLQGFYNLMFKPHISLLFQSFERY